MTIDLAAVQQLNATHKCDVLLIGYENQQNLGLRSIAAYLQQKGLYTRIEPCQNVAPEALLSKVQELNPRIIGFSLIFQRMLPDFAALLKYFRDHGVDAHFTIGGHFATLEPVEILKIIPELDSVVRHEGELTLYELCENVDRPTHWEDIKGLAYRQNGSTVVTEARSLIRDLDVLPFPTRSGSTAKHRDVGISSIVTSRGCYYDCSFCSIQEFYREPSEQNTVRAHQETW